MSDFKAVGEGTVGGLMPVGLEAFTAMYPSISMCERKVPLTEPPLIEIWSPVNSLLMAFSRRFFRDGCRESDREAEKNLRIQ